jgi:predicted transcriptional regulator
MWMKALVVLAAEIVAAYVRTHKIDPPDLEKLLNEIYQSLARARNHAEEETPTNPSGLVPAVPIYQSIGPDYIVCLEDGKKFKSLKRHLRACYGLTPELYRSKWGLPGNYPMVAETYAKKRSRIAKKIGLGRRKSRAASKGS